MDSVLISTAHVNAVRGISVLQHWLLDLTRRHWFVLHKAVYPLHNRFVCWLHALVLRLIEVSSSQQQRL